MNTRDKIMDARSAILGRIEAALPGAPAGRDRSFSAIRRGYERRKPFSQEDLSAMFVENLREYDCEVMYLGSCDDISSAIDRVLEQSRDISVIVDPIFPREWLPINVEVSDDPCLAGVVVTTCQVAIASTGTIFLAHHGAQGKRALTLLPNHHICLVRRDQIVGTVPEAIEQMVPWCKQPMTSISGPSATSDIEMTRIRGVHGPNILTVLLYA